MVMVYVTVASMVVYLRIDSVVTAATPPCLRQWISSSSVPSLIIAALEYRMARNFRGLKILWFLWINHEPWKFYPRKFYPRSAHTQCAVRLVSTWPSVFLSILCSVVVSLWLSTDILQALEKSSCKLTDPRGPLSRLIPSSSIIYARESAECVGKQGEHSQWANGTTLLQARSRTEGRISAGRQQSTSWLRLPDC